MLQLQPSWPNLWLVPNYLHRDIYWHKSSGRYQTKRFGYEYLPAGSPELWPVNSEVGSDISKPCSRQKRINNRVSNRIAILVSFKFWILWPNQTPEHQLAFGRKFVGIHTDPSAVLAKQCLGTIKIGPCGHLEGMLISGNDKSLVAH